MRLLPAALLLLTLPARAEERQVPVEQAPRAADVQMLRACMDSGKDCALKVDNACQAEFDATSTLGMLDCGKLENTAWDVLLAEALGRELAYAQATQAEKRETMGQAEDRTAALRLLQTNWGHYVQALCGYAELDWEGGSVAPVMGQACMLEQKEYRLRAVAASQSARCETETDCAPPPVPWPDPILPPP